MTHVREQIREEVIAALSAVAGLSGRVEASRVYRTQKAPYVLVYTTLEEATPQLVSTNNTSHRDMTVAIEIYSKAGTGAIDSEIDAICVGVEKALAFDDTKFAMCQDWHYQSLNIDVSNEGDKAAAIATLEYSFTYRVKDHDPETGV